MGFKKIFAPLVNRFIRRNNHDAAWDYAMVSFSQEGEDLVLDRLLEQKSDGFYVDVGAHHPHRFSNTYFFYRKGWRGINIDAMPNSMALFKQLRPRDINVEIPVSNQKQVLTYYVFNEPALNTFSAEEASKKDGLREYKIINKIELQTLPLSDLLDRYLPLNTSIDFLTIDVEGLDLAVLHSNNWTKYQPNIILIESLNSALSEIADNEVYIYLRSLGYQLISKTLNTMFFKKEH